MKNLVAIFLLALLLSACSNTKPQGVTCTITSFKNGDAVLENQTLAGSIDGMQSEWYIFAYTRAKLPGQPYWRSDKSAVVVEKNWTVDVVYGDSKTTPNTEFESVVILTADRNPALNIEQISDIKDNVACAQISVHR